MNVVPKLFRSQIYFYVGNLSVHDKEIGKTITRIQKWLDLDKLESDSIFVVFNSYEVGLLSSLPYISYNSMAYYIWVIQPVALRTMDMINIGDSYPLTDVWQPISVNWDTLELVRLRLDFLKSAGLAWPIEPCKACMRMNFQFDLASQTCRYMG